MARSQVNSGKDDCKVWATDLPSNLHEAEQQTQEALVASTGQFRYTHKDRDAQLFEGREPLLTSAIDTSHSYKPYYNCACI